MLLDLAVTGIAGQPLNRRTGSGGFPKQITAQRLEAGLVGEVGEVELTDLLRIYLGLANTCPV